MKKINIFVIAFICVVLALPVSADNNLSQNKSENWLPINNWLQTETWPQQQPTTASGPPGIGTSKPTDDPIVPIDGGMSILFVLGAAYGAYVLKRREKRGGSSV